MIATVTTTTIISNQIDLNSYLNNLNNIEKLMKDIKSKSSKSIEELQQKVIKSGKLELLVSYITSIKDYKNNRDKIIEYYTEAVNKNSSIINEINIIKQNEKIEIEKLTQQKENIISSLEKVFGNNKIIISNFIDNE